MEYNYSSVAKALGPGFRTPVVFRLEREMVTSKITLQLLLGGTSILEVLILHHMYVSKPAPSFIL